MAEEQKGIHCVKTLPNLPAVTRGYGYNLNYTTKKTPEFIYTNKNSVIMRSLEDFTECHNFDGHKGKNVTAANFSTNGEWVASGDEHGMLKIWGRKNKNERYEYNVLSSQVNDISWDADSKRLIACGNGGKPPYAKVIMWDSGSSVGGIEGAAQLKSILSCEYSKQRPYRIVCGGEDNSVTMHSGPPFKANWAKCTVAEGGHDRYPNRVRFNPDNSKFATVGSDNKILIFETKTCTVEEDGKPTKKMKPTQELKDDNGHTGAIWSFDWNDDGTELLTCGADKTAKIWNVESGSVTTTFTISETPTVDDMQMSAMWCGDKMLTVSLSGAINVLDRDNSSAPKQVIHGHKGQVMGVAVAKDGTIYTSCNEAKISRWTAYSAQWLPNRPEKKAINHLALSHDDKVLISTGFDNKVNFSCSTEGKVGTSAEMAKPAASLAAGKATGVCAVAYGEQIDIYKQSGDSWAKASTITLKDKAMTMDFNNDDSLLAVGVGKNTLVFDLEGKEVWASDVLHYKIGQVAWSPCGNFLGMTCKSSTFIMNKADGYKQMNKSDWEFHSGLNVWLMWTNNGKCVTVSNDDTMIVWSDTEKFSTKKEKKIGLHINGIQDAVLVDDNNVLTVGQDGVMKVWRI